MTCHTAPHQLHECRQAGQAGKQHPHPKADGRWAQCPESLSSKGNNTFFISFTLDEAMHSTSDNIARRVAATGTVNSCAALDLLRNDYELYNATSTRSSRGVHKVGFRCDIIKPQPEAEGTHQVLCNLQESKTRSAPVRQIRSAAKKQAQRNAA